MIEHIVVIKSCSASAAKCAQLALILSICQPIYYPIVQYLIQDVGMQPSGASFIDRE